MIKYIAFVVLFLLPQCVEAQIVLAGKVEYQRKMNIHRQFDDMMDEGNSRYMEAFMAKMPKFDVRTFTLHFNTRKSKYAPVKQTESPMFSMMGGLPGTENQVLNDYTAQRFLAYKKVYEQNYLVEDTMRQLTWKILEEVRNIAGYSCRKAVTKINDSVVVVAFYTDKIPVSGGPELFTGLPGMILELAIPRLYTTWIAQSVVLQTVAETDLIAPDKGKKTNIADLEQSIRSSTKNWGKFADKSIWWSSL